MVGVVGRAVACRVYPPTIARVVIFATLLKGCQSDVGGDGRNGTCLRIF